MKEIKRRSVFCGIHWSAAILYLAFWGFCLWMAYQIPYTHDDWDWGLPVGIEQLLTANINSRYVGNFLVVLLTRSVFLKTFVMGTTLFMLPVVCVRIASGKFSVPDLPSVQVVLFCAGAILLLTVNRIGWNETIGWVSGFCNFVFSGLMMGLFLVFSSGMYDGKSPKPCGWLKAVGLFFFCVALQLFLENITVYIVCVSLAFFIIDWIKNRRASLRFGAILAGAVVGAAIMFSSSMYDTLLSTGQAIGGYRKLIVDFSSGVFPVIKALAQRFIMEISPGLWESNSLLMFLLFATMLWLAVKKPLRSRALSVLVAVGAIIFMAFFAATGLGWTPALKESHVFIYYTLANGFTFLCGAAALFLLFLGEGRKQFKLLMLWCSAPLVVLPIVVVELIGFRLFFISNIFYIFLFASMLWECLREEKRPIQLCFAIVGVAILIFVCAFWTEIYAVIGSIFHQQMYLIAQAKATNADQLILPMFPSDEYLHCPYPGDSMRMDFYKAFYGIADNVSVIFK